MIQSDGIQPEQLLFINKITQFHDDVTTLYCKLTFDNGGYSSSNVMYLEVNTIKMSVTENSPNTVFALLYRLIMKIPEVQDVFNESGINTDDSHDPHIINFIKALGIIYSQKQVKE